MRIARIARVGATNRVVRARAGRSLFDRLLDSVTPKDVPSDARADETYETWRAMCSKETLACVEAGTLARANPRAPLAEAPSHIGEQQVELVYPVDTELHADDVDGLCWRTAAAGSHVCASIAWLV